MAVRETDAPGLPGRPGTDDAATGRSQTGRAAADRDESGPDESGRVRPDGGGFSRRARHPSVVAVVVWLLGTPVALGTPGLLDASPFGNRSWGLVFASAFLTVGVVAAVWLRWARDTLAGAAAGLLAVWVVFALRMALHGTPYGFGGLLGDAGRMAAMATRYTTTWASADAWVPGVVSEYPPLYPWLVGRAAVLFDMPAWRLLAIVQCVTVSAAVIVAFVLWRRLVPAWVALAIAGLCLVVTGEPRKAYEVLALFAFIPWALSTFGWPNRGRMHWLPAGIIGGLILQTYLGWFLFGALGLLAIAYLTWRREDDRRAYLWHLVKVVAVAAVTASWYLGPYAWAMLTADTNAVSDLFQPDSLNLGVFPFLESTPLAVLQLIGLAGLMWYAQTLWWAAPLLALAAGAFAYRVLSTIRYALTGHTMFFHYTANLYGTVLTIAGVLVLVHAAPRVFRRLGLTPPRRMAAAVLILAMLWVPYTYSRGWFPAGLSPMSYYTVGAHVEPVLGGGYPRYAPAADRTAPFPVDQIRSRVEAVRGPGARPVTLSPDERLFAFLPWPGYLGTSRMSANSLVRWDDRAAELRQLAAVADPAAFARDSAATPFGPIDVFILTRDRDALNWTGGIRFQRGQFDPAQWVIAEDLPDNLVVITRRP